VIKWQSTSECITKAWSEVRGFATTGPRVYVLLESGDVIFVSLEQLWWWNWWWEVRRCAVEWQSFISYNAVFHTELIEARNQFYQMKRITCSSDDRDILWDTEESSHLKDRDRDGFIICIEVYRRNVCCLGLYCTRVLPTGGVWFWRCLEFGS